MLTGSGTSAAGDPVTLRPGLRRIRAPNPSPMTGPGTNTYLVGETDIALIDPGPDMPAHRDAILAALRPGERISHILVTHSHLDHSALCPSLAAATRAPVHGFGAAAAGRSPVMTQLAQEGLTGGGEGVDHGFLPERYLADGDRIAGAGWTLVALHTPGHMGNHLCYAWGPVLFTGDHVMGWSTSLVSPPDGDMTDYMASLHRLSRTAWVQFLPGHGAPVDDPAARLAALIAHRQDREAAILAALSDAPGDLASLTARVYGDTPATLWPAAARNLLAHLVDLKERNLVSAAPALGLSATFSRI